MIDWGSVPDWLAGGGAVAALFFAGITARTALKATTAQANQLKEIQDAESRRLRDQVRAQASQVTAWIRFDSEGRGTVVCMNGSGQPVYNVTFSCETPVATVPVYYAVKGPDGQPKSLNYATERLRDAVENSADFRSGRQTWSRMYRENGLRVPIHFMDINGQWWTRDSRGLLVESSPPSVA